MEMIPFKARHVELILGHEADSQMLRLAKIAEDYGTGFTGCLLGDPIGAAGVVMHEQKIGEVWALFSPTVRALPFQLFKRTKECLDKIIEIEKPEKLMVIVHDGDEAAKRFVRHLGFSMKSFVYEREI